MTGKLTSSKTATESY